MHLLTVYGNMTLENYACEHRQTQGQMVTVHIHDNQFNNTF